MGLLIVAIVLTTILVVAMILLFSFTQKEIRRLDKKIQSLDVPSIQLSPKSSYDANGNYLGKTTNIPKENRPLIGG